MAVTSVDCTEAAAELLRELRAEHGDLLFHQSGGCCDGSAPMCYPRGEFRIGARDVLLGEIAGCPFFIGGDQFEYWKHTRLTIDVVKGRGGGFSVEAPRGVRFLVRSSVLSAEEVEALEAAGPPPRGPDAL
ncbi:MAG TPA: DUF779 domain-containing protein [Myxococcota bacterium]|nr:DUF779 domain-containing protein [Myxococcota bacterium]